MQLKFLIQFTVLKHFFQTPVSYEINSVGHNQHLFHCNGLENQNNVYSIVFWDFIYGEIFMCMI